VEELDPEPEGDVEGLRLLVVLARLGSAVTSAMTGTGVAPRLVSNRAAITLCLLELDGPSRATDLADRLGMTRGGTTKLLDRLERAELVTSDRASHDRRWRRVAITDHGRGIITTGARHLIDSLAEVPALRAGLGDLADTLDNDVPRPHDEGDEPADARP